MGIKHKTVKASGEQGYATEWNEEHIIDSDIDFAGFSGVNVGEPINPSDIATKNYVDNLIGFKIQYGYSTESKDITFPEPFNTPPTVVITPVSRFVEGSSVRNVTTTGFRAECVLPFYWIAIGT